MNSSIKDAPVTLEVPQGTLRHVQWGGMTIEMGEVRQTTDMAPLFRGLPDDRCQCPHWGYVLKGHQRFKFPDHEEVYNVGDVYYTPPGHTPTFEAGCEYIQFSPTDQLSKTLDVLMRNLKAMQSGQS